MSGFRPGWLPSVLVLLLLPVLLGLGFWQLQRGEQKQQLLDAFEARRQSSPIFADALLRSADPGYQRVRLQGYFDREHSLLLDNRVRDGRAGVELLQPFHDQLSGLWVLVNRGWLPWPDRRIAPAFSTPDGTLQLQAWAYVAPGGGLQLSGADGEGWPRLVTVVEADLLWQQLNRSGLPYELRLEPGPASYRLGWPVVAMSPGKHQGYAVQWFALAAALLGLYVYLGIHNAREHRHEPSHRHV